MFSTHFSYDIADKRPLGLAQRVGFGIISGAQEFKGISFH
jgi:hypothetical protein